MRKLTITAVLLFSLGMFLTSCGGGKKEKSEDVDKTEAHEEHAEHSDDDVHDHSEDMATAVYQCPMKCEDEKTYPEPGTCPECKMKLKEVKSEEE
jgi:hypothetical protein